MVVAYNNLECITMARARFSVPNDVKHALNETFKNRNKGATIEDLMREAVQRRRDDHAAQSILRRRRRPGRRS